MKTRLDAELVRRELARSRENAADLIESRSVLVNGIPATKPATQVDAETSITLQGKRDDFVSRGGHKLAGALDHFTGVTVEGKICLDAGASTGGFTDVLLRRGASRVVAVDVGYGQLAWELRTDERVKILLRSIFQALPPGGKLLVAEPMADTPEHPAMGHAYFGFYLLAMGRGRPRTIQEISNLAVHAGFKGVEVLRCSMPINAQVLLISK